MRSFIRILFVILLLKNFSALGQDMHFTQFYSSSIYLNPAFTGADVCSRFSATYRNQWPGISNAYKTYLASFDHYITTYNIGVGLLVGSDIAGTGQLKTTVINPLIAYEATLTKKLNVRLGVQPGIGIRSINFNNLVFGDQIARGGNVATMEVPTQNRTFFDIGAGMLAYTRNAWAGLSFFHLNKPNESLRGENDYATLPLKYSFHAGYKYALNPDEKEELQRRSFSAALNYRGQAEFDQLDIGFYYTQYVFNLGLWYRGLPGLKAYKPGYSNNDALAVVVGVKTERMNIGYSYDATISKLTNKSGGAHEITVSYQLCKLNKKKKKRLLVPCPKF
jgi:type IX secretion system PorP/SprF family membrane protein